MAKPTPHVEDLPADEKTPEEYIPLSKARVALRGVLDDPDFAKTRWATQVAYALGALEEDVDGGVAETERAEAHRGRKLEEATRWVNAAVQLLPHLMDIGKDKGPKIVEVPSVPFGAAWQCPPETRRCESNPAQPEMWRCCHCPSWIPFWEAIHEGGTACPRCNHTRCDIHLGEPPR